MAVCTGPPQSYSAKTVDYAINDSQRSTMNKDMLDVTMNEPVKQKMEVKQ